jgi:cation diffusion facilitator family transporter
MVPLKVGEPTMTSSTGTVRPDLQLSLRRRAAQTSLLIGGGMLVLKAVAYLLTNSSAIFSDALESVVHLGAIGMASYSVVISARPPDRSHPYGHGKVEFFSAGIEGALIALSAIGIIAEAVHGLIAGKEVENLETGAVLILVASGVNLVLGRFLVGRGKQTFSLTLEADGRHILTDSHTSLGVFAGLALIQLTGMMFLDD